MYKGCLEFTSSYMCSKDLLVTESSNRGFLEFSCKPGLILEGKDKIYCDGSQWSDETPKCVYNVSTEATTVLLATTAVSTETGHSSNQSAPTTETDSTDNNRQGTKPTEQPGTKAKTTEQPTTSATVKSSERSNTTENLTTLTTAEPRREAKTEPKGTTTLPPSSTQKPQKPTTASSPTTTEVKTTTAAPAKTSLIGNLESTTVTRSMDSATSKLTDQQKKRKCENDISDLQKQVLHADLCRINEETELIKLQKEKVSLEIKKLKYENLTTLTTAEPSREAKTEPKGTMTFPSSSTQKPQKPTTASSPTTTEKKRKCENDISDLQKQVLHADLCRINKETELIKLQKEKVSLEIKKLRYEVSLCGVQS
uniref:Sushi domain-containing protein n=1 Tax=Magallana gigas TaxID=29159 RepID=A0A8W8NJF2_MAGGI